MITDLKSGDKVIYNYDRYDFGYYSQSEDKVVLYEEGCRNMQDSFVVPLSKISRPFDPSSEKRCGHCGK